MLVSAIVPPWAQGVVALAVADTDGDGLSDSAEVLTHGSSPLLADTDGDGLSDAQEVTHGTGLNNPDSDGD